MYLGAAVSLTKVFVDLATYRTTRSDLLSVTPNPSPFTVSEFDSGFAATLALVCVLGLIGVGLWIFVARASRNGEDWARTTGSVLFGLDTMGLLIGPVNMGIRGPQATVAQIFIGVVWLIGLTAVAFLWWKDPRAFFKPRNSP
jgi:hypothetical protein